MISGDMVDVCEVYGYGLYEERHGGMALVQDESKTGLVEWEEWATELRRKCCNTSSVAST